MLLATLVIYHSFSNDCLNFIEVEILHFNDVYNIEGKQPDKTPTNDDWEVLGGAGRFKTAFDIYDSKNKLVVFSGDLFFPSIRKFIIS